MQKKPTLELPQHVHRVVVKGREYFYFQRGRGTASAGPSVKLPGGPHTVEFWAAYKTQLNGDVSTGRSFNDLILAYRVSPEFDKRAASTKRDYLRYLEIISKAWGELLVSDLRPKHVIGLRDKWASTPVAANHLIAVLKTLVTWGIPREFCETNPCAYVPKLETDEVGARPWPVWAYSLIEEHAREDVRRAVCWLDTPARDSLMCCVWPQATLRTAGSTWCSRRPARSCGCPFTTIWWVRWRAGAAPPSCTDAEG